MLMTVFVFYILFCKKRICEENFTLFLNFFFDNKALIFEFG